MSSPQEEIPDDPLVSTSLQARTTIANEVEAPSSDQDHLSSAPNPPEMPVDPVNLKSERDGLRSDGDGAAEGRPMRTIRIAVAGCSHGEMDKIYASLEEIERQNGYKLDLLISCGDYQAVRNYGDLQHMHVNEKYRQLQTFYRYYAKEIKAPLLTVFVGGNHEASGFLSELPYGGWVAPSIYYMGHASVIRFAGLRIGGLSGIYKYQDYNKGHYECPPFSENGSLISAYHVRSLEIFRLKQLKWTDDRKDERLDIMVSHDWPASITDYGNKSQLLRIKPYFKEDIDRNQLGNPATMDLVHQLRPRYWLAAHLHVAWAALVPHPDDEVTRFLSLDKPLPRRQFIQILEFSVPADADMKLSYDPTWLAILRNTDQYTCVSNKTELFPTKTTTPEGRWDFRPFRDEMDDIAELGDLHVPEDFYQTAPPHRSDDNPRIPASLYYRNPQTARFCAWLGITDLNNLLAEKAEKSGALGTAHFLLEKVDATEIPIDDDDMFGDSETDFVLDSRPRDGDGDDEETADDAPVNIGEDAEDDNVEEDLDAGVEVPEGEEESHAYLSDFAAPKWRGSGGASQMETPPIIKRRKVDLDEEDEE